jgi:hypothetical protein
MTLDDANELLYNKYTNEYTWVGDCVQGVKLDGGFSSEDLREIADILDSIEED